ncbi:DUF4132 domain-containing protein [Nonomuraea wenchangensis]
MSVRSVAGDAIHRLEQATVNRRRWSAGDFGRLLVGHPLLWHIVRRLVWGLRRGWRRGAPQDAGWQGWIEQDVPGGRTIRSASIRASRPATSTSPASRPWWGWGSTASTRSPPPRILRDLRDIT